VGGAFAAVGHGLMSGTDKLRQGIATGARSSGGFFKKGASAVGHGISATGEKIADGTKAAGEKVADGAKAGGGKLVDGSKGAGGKVAVVPKPLHGLKPSAEKRTGNGEMGGRKSERDWPQAQAAADSRPSLVDKTAAIPKLWVTARFRSVERLPPSQSRWARRGLHIYSEPTVLQLLKQKRRSRIKRCIRLVAAG